MENLKKDIVDTFVEIESRLDALLGIFDGKQVLLSDFYGGDTVGMTILMSNLFEHFLPLVSNQVQGAPGCQKGYDFTIDDKHVEMKMTGAIGSNTSFTSGAHQSKDTAEEFMLIRYKMDEQRNRPSQLGIWITPSLTEMPISAAYLLKSRNASLDAGNSNFSSIKISSKESHCITPLFGGKKLNKVWTKQVLENVEYK